jgi:hypothetical protein
MFSLKQMLDNGHRVQILYTFFVTDEARVRSMFVFLSSLIFAGKARARQCGAPYCAQSVGRLLALPVMTMANTKKLQL